MKNDNEQLVLQNNKLKTIISSQSNKIKSYNDFINLENYRFENRFNNTLNKLLSPTQIQLLLHPKKKVYSWEPEDISSAITLRSISPKAYRYLRNEKQFLLPGKIVYLIDIYHS